MVLFMLKNNNNKKRYVEGGTLQNISWNYTKQERYTFFSKLGKHSVCLKGAMGTLRPSHCRADGVTERFDYNTLLISQQWSAGIPQWMSLIGKLNTLTCPTSLKETVTWYKFRIMRHLSKKKKLRWNFLYNICKNRWKKCFNCVDNSFPFPHKPTLSLTLSWTCIHLRSTQRTIKLDSTFWKLIVLCVSKGFRAR